MASTSTNGANHGDDDLKTRSRVSQACSRCRARKDRCDGGRPSCSACLSVGQTCTYESTTKKRGLPEGYVRGLEKLFALASRNIQGLELALSELLNHDQVRKSWNTHTGDDLHGEWKESLVLKDLESLLSDVQTVSSGQKRKRQGEQNDDDSEENQNIGLDELDLQYHVTNVSHQNKTSKPLNLSQVHLPTNARQLLDQYFAYTHCWLPILNRPQVLRKFYEVSKSQTPITEQDVKRDGRLAVLCAILAYTIQHSRLGNSLHPDTMVIAENSSSLAALALSSLPTDDKGCTIAHSQALIILALLKIGLGEWITAWVLVGTALRISLAQENTIQNHERNMYRAVLQGCIVLDVVVSLHLKTKAHAAVVNLAKHVFMDEDGHDEWEPWCPPGSSSEFQDPSFAISTFNQLTKIFGILVEGSLNGTGVLQSSNARMKLEQLHGMVNPGSIGGVLVTEQNPPHQIFLQLARVQAQLWLMSLPVDIGSGYHQRAQMSCNVLSLLEALSSSRHAALRLLPPFMVDCLKLALEQGHHAQSAFGPNHNLPSYTEFISTATDYQQRLSQIWPVFSLSSPIENQQHMDAGPRRLADTTIEQTGLYSDGTRIGVDNFDFITGPAVPGRPISDPFATQTNLPSLLQSIGTPRPATASDYDNWSAGSNPILSNNPLERRNTNTSAILIPDHNSVSPHPHRTHSAITLFDQTQPRTAGIPVNSPASYQGDEIDAIFREMAQLDANEWSTERAVGLKDFGFNDDLAFQAFCNDPERLATPFNATGPPLSSNRQTWTFTDQGQ